MTGVRIGTSGWHYESWIGPFYPEGTVKKRLLEAYAERFSTSEINASFYRVPTEKAVRSWIGQVPEGFLFAWKASRFITHFKRLKEVGENIDFIIGRMVPLGAHFGPILWQLPPQMKPDYDRFARFLDDLPGERQHAVEFRNPDWYDDPFFELLREHNVALCLSDHAAAPAPWCATADHVYLRGHGPGGRYAGSYSDETLGAWADAIAAWHGAGKAVHCYFDNDQKSAAPFDAMRLKDLVANRGTSLA